MVRPLSGNSTYQDLARRCEIRLLTISGFPVKNPTDHPSLDALQLFFTV